MAEAFIKLYKKMLKWEWYHDTNTFRLFMHCLLKANWQDGSWRGVEYEAGQFITSLSKLSQETGLSVHQIRGSLERLKTSGELAIKTTNKYRVITVNNWNKYQVGGKQTDKQTANKPATDKEYKNIRIIDNTLTNARKEIILGIYHNVRLTQDELQELINQYPNDYKDMIDNLSTYMRSKGKLYDDHFATMMRWKHEDQEKAKQKPETKRRNLIEEIRNA